MPLLMKVVPVVVLLGGLIFVHELGHFLFAKLFNVKVLKFSIGFGPKLFAFTRGETEYRLALLPLGGYVKMAGDDPSQPLDASDAGRNYLEQAPHRRALIALAGPAFNLLFPLILYFAIFLAPRELPSTRVGYVVPGRPAAVAGVQVGDRIVAVDGSPAKDFADLKELIEAKPGQPLALTLDRGGKRVDLTLTAGSELDDNPIEAETRGKIGIAPFSHAPIVGVAAGSAAARAGLKTFDRIETVDGRKVASYEELTARLGALGDHGFAVTALRQRPVPIAGATLGVDEHITAAVNPYAYPVGFEPEERYVFAVEPGSPAALAGVARGDEIVSVDAKPVTTWDDVQARLAAASAAHAETLAVGVLRGGAPVTLTVKPQYRQQRDQMGARVMAAYVGLVADNRPDTIVPGETVRVSTGPLTAARRSVQKLGELVRLMSLGILRIVEGRISYETMGGPIMLYQVASKSAEAGLDAFLWTMGIISVNLGLMNLLPIPVLDGFHILSAVVEAVRRRPLSLRFREVANVVGLVMLLALMLLVFKNDIVRSFFE